jgi:hypothetical protein
MPKGYVNLEQIARIDFLMSFITIKVINTCSKPSEEIIIFTIKNIEFK